MAMLRFGRHGGVLALANALLLLVNMDGQTRYANQLLDGGRRMTWFPGSGQRPDDSLSRRLCGDEPILLLCRATSRDAYVCCGRLQLLQWSWDGRAWLWGLNDWEAAAGRSDFAQLMRVYSSP